MKNKNILLGFCCSLTVMVVFMFGCDFIGADYERLKFLNGWLSCMAFMIGADYTKE